MRPSRRIVPSRARSRTSRGAAAGPPRPDSLGSLREALKIEHCEFVRAVERPEDEPKTSGPLVVFFGRSNVGKSSMINRLLGAKGLARTSSTPGRTQTVNFYAVNGAVHFVDLPGYGWARVSREARQAWRPMIEGFLKRRAGQIAMAISLVDARHAPTELDRVLKTWLEDRGLPHLVVATKADKLSGNDRARLSAALQEAFPAGGAAKGWIFASAETGAGTREIWKHLDEALEAFPSVSRGEAWTSGN